MRNSILIAALAGVVVAALTIGRAETKEASDRLVVHEWGTFTCIQDEQGHELTGVNIDDEPVPEFVHNLQPYLLNAPLISSDYWQYRQKASPRQHPLVTMRLETPVIYFHPPARAKLPMTLDVDVAFRGGWLTEFYPLARPDAPGLKQGIFEFGELTPQTVGRLSWKDLQVGTQAVGPQTDEHVWTAPRQVISADVTAASGESERYLFYRGVGNLRAPLRVATDIGSEELAIRGNFQDVLAPDQRATIPRLWLVHIRDDGKTAFREIDAIEATASPDDVLAVVRANFEEAEYDADNLDAVQTQMHTELVEAGLYPDEAAAMLATWRRAYFQSPGLRLFFPVPRAWTDLYLPLELSVAAEIERVMMGRIELITPRQRELLARIAAGPASDGKWIDAIPHSHSAAVERIRAGRADFGDPGVAVPDDYAAYVELGRFRNALVVAEERRRPTEAISKFIDTYALHPYRWEAKE
ncbi:MAG: hypothetical protein WDZ59_15680 [Pirellulales bacterium]